MNPFSARREPPPAASEDARGSASHPKTSVVGDVRRSGPTAAAAAAAAASHTSVSSRIGSGVRDAVRIRAPLAATNRSSRRRLASAGDVALLSRGDDDNTFAVFAAANASPSARRPVPEVPSPSSGSFPIATRIASGSRASNAGGTRARRNAPNSERSSSLAARPAGGFRLGAVPRRRASEMRRSPPAEPSFSSSPSPRRRGVASRPDEKGRRGARRGASGPGPNVGAASRRTASSRNHAAARAARATVFDSSRGPSERNPASPHPASLPPVFANDSSNASVAACSSRGSISAVAGEADFFARETVVLRVTKASCRLSSRSASARAPRARIESAAVPRRRALRSARSAGSRSATGTSSSNRRSTSSARRWRRPTARDVSDGASEESSAEDETSASCRTRASTRSESARSCPWRVAPPSAGVAAAGAPDMARTGRVAPRHLPETI